MDTRAIHPEDGDDDEELLDEIDSAASGEPIDEDEEGDID